MKWFDEMRLTSRCDSFELLGIVFFIREVMGNRLRLSTVSADEIFGEGWMAKVDRLAKAGVVQVEWSEGAVLMRVVAPGDRRRQSQKRIMKIRRRTKGLK